MRMAAMRAAEEATAAGRVKAARTTTAAASAAMPTPSGSAPCPPAADNNDLVGGDDHDESGDGEGEGGKGHGHVGMRSVCGDSTKRAAISLFSFGARNPFGARREGAGVARARAHKVRVVGFLILL